MAEAGSMRWLLLLAALAVANTIGPAERAAAGDVAIIGAGVLSHGAWTADRRDGGAAVDQ